MRHQAIGKLALMLGVLLIAAASAEASPVRYDDVVALATVAGQSGRPSVDLRMRQTATTGQQVASTKSTPAPDQKQSVVTPDLASAPAPSTSTPSLTGTEVAPQSPQGGNVETVDLGEVQGTVCDCGPIRIPGGFPKWPWLALGAVPFIFIHHGCDTQPSCDTGPCTQETPTPTPTPSVPEPATIFLLGTGLAAVAARARRAAARRTVNINNEATEV